MMAKAHKLSGTFVSAPMLFVEPVPLLVRFGFVFICTYAALVPDWDHHSSTITKGRVIPIRPRRRRWNPIKRWSRVRKSDPWLEWVAYKVGVQFPFWFVSIHLRALSRLAQVATRAQADRRGKSAHRMLTHTGLGAVGFGLAFWGLTSYIPGPVGEWSWFWGLAMFLGCMAHIAGDMLTPGGCPIWWPRKIQGRRWYMVSAKLFKTDTIIEHLIVVPLLYVATGGVIAAGILVFHTDLLLRWFG